MRLFRCAADASGMPAGVCLCSEPAGKPDVVCGHAVLNDPQKDDKIPPGNTDLPGQGAALDFVHSRS